MAKLKLLILCGQSARHLYVANRLCDVADVRAIVHETQSFSAMKVVRKITKPHLFARKAWRWVRDRRRYTGNKEGTFFFGDEPAVLRETHLRRFVPHINSPELLELADKLRPDLIAVFGTSLIRGPLLECGRLGIVNLHGGLSPDYRGADCTFWALYNREPEKVGCTLHYINAGIDTGSLIAHICPMVQQGDDELSLFWRAVKDSAEIYAQLIDRVGQGEQFGREQNQKGHLYQVKDRGYVHERKLDLVLNNGLLNDVSLPPRVEWFQNA